MQWCDGWNNSHPYNNQSIKSVDQSIIHPQTTIKILPQIISKPQSIPITLPRWCSTTSITAPIPSPFPSSQSSHNNHPITHPHQSRHHCCPSISSTLSDIPITIDIYSHLYIDQKNRIQEKNSTSLYCVVSVWYLVIRYKIVFILIDISGNELRIPPLPTSNLLIDTSLPK